MLWIALAAITVVSLGILLLPLWRREPYATTPRGAYDRAIYRDQLAELERDIARGVLSAEQAAAVRTEVQRRMLATDSAENVAADVPPPSRWKLASLAAVLAVAALLLYALLGASQLPGSPYAAQATYTAQMWSALGESFVMANRGEVVPDARAAFLNALKKDPNDPRAQFYTGLAFAQDNHVKEALTIWRNLLNHSAADAPWVDMLKEQIAFYADPKRALAGAVMAAAPEQKTAMIRGMVAKLEAKLAAHPDDVAGWEMLARSYHVLGDEQKSEAAAKKAAALQQKE